MEVTGKTRCAVKEGESIFNLFCMKGFRFRSRTVTPHDLQRMSVIGFDVAIHVHFHHAMLPVRIGHDAAAAVLAAANFHNNDFCTNLWVRE